MRTNPDKRPGGGAGRPGLAEADLLDRCRSRGLRVTGQRLAVYRALAGDPSHPTADAVYAALQPAMPSLSRATVYRILESLERENLVRRVSTTAGGARFDANLAPHQHLVCRVCGKIADWTSPALARRAAGAVPGFVVEELEIRIVGRCAGCRAAPGRGTEDRGRPRGMNPNRRR